MSSNNRPISSIALTAANDMPTGFSVYAGSKYSNSGTIIDCSATVGSA
jgi:hypothetical protein